MSISGWIGGDRDGPLAHDGGWRGPEQVPLVEPRCKERLGVALPMANVKDFAMIELWDD